MNPIKILTISGAIALLSCGLGAGYYFGIALPRYNQQIIDIQIREAKEKKETEEKLAKEKKEKEIEEELRKIQEKEEKNNKLKACLNGNFLEYTSQWKSSCESWKKEVDKRYKTCMSIFPNAEYCKNNGSDYAVDGNGTCKLPSSYSENLEKNRKEGETNCYSRLQ